MKFEDCKIGMTVKMNELSNDRYSITTKSRGCVGKIVNMYDFNNTVVIRVLEHSYHSYVGKTFDIEPQYFDPVYQNNSTICENSDYLLNVKVVKKDNAIEVYYNNKKLATAKCNPNDKWDEEFGLALAFSRALKEMKTSHEIITIESVSDYL